MTTTHCPRCGSLDSLANTVRIHVYCTIEYSAVHTVHTMRSVGYSRSLTHSPVAPAEAQPASRLVSSVCLSVFNGVCGFPSNFTSLAQGRSTSRTRSPHTRRFSRKVIAVLFAATDSIWSMSDPKMVNYRRKQHVYNNWNNIFHSPWFIILSWFTINKQINVPIGSFFENVLHVYFQPEERLWKSEKNNPLGRC